MKKLSFAAAIIAAASALAGPLTPPPGPVTPTGRFGPRIDVATLPGSATAMRVISQPGSYYLSANLAGAAGKSGITITTDRVTLDLGGYSVMGVSGSLHGIDLGGADYVSIANGVIGAWGGDGLRGTPSFLQVRDVISRSNGGWGMNLAVGGHETVVHCTATYNGTGGIALGDWGLITRTLSSNNTGGGIVVNSTSNIVDNVVSANTGTGIQCGADCLVRGNIATSNAVNIGANFSTLIQNEQ